jgi:hypothetical protein
MVKNFVISKIFCFSGARQCLDGSLSYGDLFNEYVWIQQYSINQKGKPPFF